VLTVAQKYGQAPQDVEKWDEYWFNRAAELDQGEAIHQATQMKKMRKGGK
jgi:hypothetical protein